jgi:glycine/D-amino acid oxidase-like deaminating enzyme
MSDTTTWKTDREKRFPQLTENIEANVVIVGGGLAALWCAYELTHPAGSKEKKVVVLEKDRLGHGETYYTTAFLNQSIDTALVDLQKMFGKSTARLVWTSHQEAIEKIEEAAKKEQIDCELRRDSLFLYATTEDEYKSLEEEAEAAKKLGFEVSLHPKLFTTFSNQGALEIKNQATYHPLKFFWGMVDVLEKRGVKFFERSEVINLKHRKVGVVVSTEKMSVLSQDVIVATYKPFNKQKNTHFKKGMYTTYVYELHAKKGSVPPGMYIDQMNPYHYIRVDVCEGFDRIIIGGEDHRSELKLEKQSFKALLEFVRTTFPNMQYEIANKWSGRILEPSDGLALIGAVKEHEYIASAFSGNGMTYSCISGNLLADLIRGKANKYKKVYDPTRPLLTRATFKKARDYGGEFFGGAVKNMFK